MTEQQRRLNEGVWGHRINLGRAIAQNSKPVSLPPVEWVEIPILFIGGTPANAQPVPISVNCDRDLCETRGAICPGCPAQA